MRELLLEIWSSISKNKLRTVLTGFSVAWGIFMLVILLGSGNGLKNGILSNFGDKMVNTMQVSSWRTSKPFAGYAKNRWIELNARDMDVLKAEFGQIEDIAARSYYNDQKMVFGNRFQSGSLVGLTDKMARMEGITIIAGRFFNEQDLAQFRKVIIIDDITQKILFQGVDPLGQQIISGGIAYNVIGIYQSNVWANSARCYIPLSVGRLIFNANNPRVHRIMFSVNGIEKDEELDAFQKDVVKRLSIEHKFAPDDLSAIWINNNQKEYQSFLSVFNGINIFVWIIGLGTMIAGIVGVSNIMLVTVRERTFEFGVRKALGARPRSIIFLILLESVLITAFFGYMGMVGGVAVMEAVNYYIESQRGATDGMTTFLNPTLDLSITFSATVLLVVAGLVAGYVPARRAARLKTIDALRFNK